jgi:hypothetical protein
VYYYYTTANYSNYLDALLGVNAYAQQQAIPYKAVLLDSWWCVRAEASHSVDVASAAVALPLVSCRR